MRASIVRSAVVLVLVTGCSSETKPVLADVAWQLSCTATPVGACTPLDVSGKRWDYVQYDGKVAIDESSGATLGIVDARCSGTDIGGGVTRFSLRAEVGDAYVTIEGLNVVRASGAFSSGPTCRTTVFDGTSIYGGSSFGGCTAAAPTTNSPCQISNVVLNHDDSDGPSIELRLLCNALPNTALQSASVSVRDAAAGISQPALIRFANCSGI